MKRLRMELKQKGIDNNVIQQVLATTERTEEEEMLKVIRKKRRKYDDQKLVAYLVRQGFDIQKSKDTVEHYSLGEDEPSPFF